MLNKHGVFERNAWLLSIGTLVVVAIGGLVEIVPLFYLKSTIEKVEGMRPLFASRVGRARHLHPRGVLHVPLADDPVAA